MDEFEVRRQSLRKLVDSFGRGGIVQVAGKLNVAPSYVSRLLSAPDSNQHRAITGEMVLTITSAFPEWMGGKLPAEVRSKTTAAAFTPDEKELLEGYRQAEPAIQKTLLLIARQASESFRKRAGKR